MEKAAAALAMGNAVMVKPPEQDPLTVIAVREAFVEAGVPAEVLADCSRRAGNGRGAVCGRASGGGEPDRIDARRVGRWRPFRCCESCIWSLAETTRRSCAAMRTWSWPRGAGFRADADERASVRIEQENHRTASIAGELVGTAVP